MKFKKKIATIIVLFFVCLGIWYINGQKAIKSQPQGTVQLGIRDRQGNLLTNGHPLGLELLNEGFNLTFEQDLYEPREYLVIFLVDYIQTDFEVNSNRKRSFYMELDSKDSVTIPINIAFSPDARELSVIIIKKPEFMVEKGDFDHAIKTEDIYSLRYPIKSSVSETMDYSTLNYHISDVELSTRVFLTEEPEKFKICTVKKSEENIYVALGNNTDKVSEYALIALKDWDQIPIQNEKVQLFKVDVGKHIYFELKLPKVNKESNYQMIVFPNPYNVNEKEPLTTFTFGSHRIHLIP